MTEQFTQRNREIGQLLRSARLRKRITVSRCADLLGTTRRRYKEIEEGRSAVTLAESEVLSQLFGLSLLALCPSLEKAEIRTIHLRGNELLSIIIGEE